MTEIPHLFWLLCIAALHSRMQIKTQSDKWSETAMQWNDMMNPVIRCMDIGQVCDENKFCQKTVEQ